MELEEIFDTYYDRIYSFTLFRVQNVHEAEDIASAVFLKAVKNIKQYDKGKALLSTWLFTIALNEIRTYYRRRRDTMPLEYADGVPSQGSVEDNVIASEEARNLYSAMTQLDERQRNIVLLKYYGQMSSKQIADILNLTETNVETILSRSKKVLKKFIETCEVSAPNEYKVTRSRGKEAENVQ